MTRIAIAYWQERVSPVFDVSGSLLIVDIEKGCEIARAHAGLHGNDPFTRAREIVALGAAILICGAVSRVQETALLDLGVRVHGFIRGETEQVLQYFLQGKLSREQCCMPGCGRCGRHREQTGKRGRHGPGGMKKYDSDTQTDE